MFKSLSKADQAKIIQTLAPEYSGKGVTPELPLSRWNKGMVVRVITASDSPDAFLSLTLKTVKITQCISDYFWGTCLKDGTDAKYSSQTDYIMALPAHPPTKDSYGLLHELLIGLLAEGNEYPNEFHFGPQHMGGPYLFKPLNITDLRKGEVIGLVGRALDYPQVYTTGLGRRWSEIADHGEFVGFKVISYGEDLQTWSDYAHWSSQTESVEIKGINIPKPFKVDSPVAELQAMDPEQGLSTDGPFFDNWQAIPEAILAPTDIKAHFVQHIVLVLKDIWGDLRGYIVNRHSRQIEMARQPLHAVWIHPSEQPNGYGLGSHCINTGGVAQLSAPQDCRLCATRTANFRQSAPALLHPWLSQLFELEHACEVYLSEAGDHLYWMPFDLESTLVDVLPEGGTSVSSAPHNPHLIRRVWTIGNQQCQLFITTSKAESLDESSGLRINVIELRLWTVGSDWPASFIPSPERMIPAQP